MSKATAKLNYLHMAPRKVRRVGNVIKGMHVQRAEAELMFMPQRAAGPMRKLLRSAVSNAKNNLHLNEERLIIADVRVDQGPMLKRWMPRAMGRATPIQKKMSHITIVLEESEKVLSPGFIIPRPVKPGAKKQVDRVKGKAEKGPVTEAETEAEEAIAHEEARKSARRKQEKEVGKEKKGVKGFAQKVFRRKSI